MTGAPRSPKADAQADASATLERPTQVDLEEAFVVTIPEVMRLLLARVRPRPAWRGLTYQQYNVLYLVATGLNGQSDIARRLGVSAPVVNRLVALLSEAGFLERKPSQTDRRAVVVSLTAKGRRRVSLMRHDLLEAATGILTPLPVAEREGISQSLRWLDGLLSDEARDPPPTFLRQRRSS